MVLRPILGEGNGTPLQYSCLENPMDGEIWWAAVHGVAKSWTRLSDFPFTFHFHALEKEMATHSSVLAWKIPGTGEPGGLPSLGSHRVGHDWSDLAAARSILDAALSNSSTLIPAAFLFKNSYSVQFNSAPLSPTLCNPMNCNTPGLPVRHQHPASTQTHVQCVGDAIQPSHPLSSPSPPALNLSQHQSLIKWVSYSRGGQNIGVSPSTSTLPMNTQDWSPLGWTGWISLQPNGLFRSLLQHHSSKHQFFSAQLSLQSNSHIHTWPLEKP